MTVRFEAVRSLAFGSISGSYTAIGTPLGKPERIIKIVNTCDTDMLISFDGTTDNEIVPAGGFVLYDFAANEAGNLDFLMSVGTQVYAKQVSAPSSGNVYVTAIYNRS